MSGGFILRRLLTHCHIQYSKQVETMSIKVLVVDDQQSKLHKLINCLTETGVGREHIDVALNGIDARRLLRKNQYDLLILDLSLPLRPEDPPASDGGADLLDELKDRSDVFIKPTYIVGVTSHSELARRLEYKFSENLWALLSATTGNDEWLVGIRKLVIHLTSLQARTLPQDYSSDVCIVTAMREPELSAIRDSPLNFEGPLALDNSSAYYRADLHSNSNEFSVIAASAPRMGMVAAGILVAKMILCFRPRIILMAGICAGVKEKVNIGDVILASPAWDWQSGKLLKKDDASVFYPDPDHLDVDQSIITCFEDIIDDKLFWFKMREDWRGDKPKEVPAGKVGPVASGSLVVADLDVIQQIKDQHRKLLGVEMEAYGVYAAARTCGSPQPLALSIKSVCDFADEVKDDRFQSYSAYVSASVAIRFLECYLPKIKTA